MGDRQDGPHRHEHRGGRQFLMDADERRWGDASQNARVTPGCSTQPDAVQDVEPGSGWGNVRPDNRRMMTNAGEDVGERREEQDNPCVHLLDRRCGRRQGVPVGTGADGVRGARLLGWRRLVGRAAGRLRLVRAVRAAPANITGFVVRLRAGRRGGRGLRLLAGEHAAPALRQRQKQAANQDQRSHGTTPHEHDLIIGNGGTSSSPPISGRPHRSS